MEIKRKAVKLEVKCVKPSISEIKNWLIRFRGTFLL
jgi:hypothetical protein